MKRAAGFTLIELVITVAILGLLASVAMPLVELTVKRGKEQELRVALRELRIAIDAYKDAADKGRIEREADTSGYPPTLDALYTGVPDISTPELKPMYFLRRLPRDPFFPDPGVPASRTWGLRSFASPPESPEPGDDVYDVFSNSTGTALNGTAYRDW
ncbi:MAG TPA: type II secretion system protein [Steroidobacteraceae bacterium]|nr:type II secretion system protein [Steroidobacteraceae bacterium]